MWTEVKSTKSNWRVTIVDGYISSGIYSGSMVASYSDKNHDSIQEATPDLAQAIGSAKRSFQEEYRQDIMLRILYSEIISPNYWPECDILFFYVPRPVAQDSNLSFSNALLTENDRPELIYLMQFDKDFPCYRECLLNVMNMISFRPKPENHYKDVSEFVDEIDKLARELLEDYPSPEPFVEELLTQRGFIVGCERR